MKERKYKTKSNILSDQKNKTLFLLDALTERMKGEKNNDSERNGIKEWKV